MSEIRLDPAAIKAWAGSDDAKAVLNDLGEQIARDAAANAPKDSGGGARSIRHEVDEDAEGALVRVSWDRDHFYMFFHEVGTSRLPARPFLRPAATKRRNL